MNISDFRDGRPTLVLEDYFEGRTQGWGFMTGQSSAIERQFSIDAVGTLEAGGTFHLTETYRFDDGSVDRLDWSITRSAGGDYRGTEPRMVGEARGEQAGNAFHWRYRRSTPMSRLALDFDDWFLLQDDGVLLASATFGRLGLTFGRMAVCYRKAQAQDVSATRFNQTATPLRGGQSA